MSVEHRQPPGPTPPPSHRCNLNSYPAQDLPGPALPPDAVDETIDALAVAPSRDPQHRAELLRLVGSMLQRKKRNALMRARQAEADAADETGLSASELRKLDAEIRRVEAELESTAPGIDRTPQKHRQRGEQVNSASGSKLGGEPSPGLTTTPPSALEEYVIGDSTMASDMPAALSPSPKRPEASEGVASGLPVDAFPEHALSIEAAVPAIPEGRDTPGDHVELTTEETQPASVLADSLSGEVLFGSARSGVGSVVPTAGAAEEVLLVPGSPGASRSRVAASSVPAMAAPPRSPVAVSPQPIWVTPKTGSSACTGSSSGSSGDVGIAPPGQSPTVAVPPVVPPLPIPFGLHTGAIGSPAAAPPPKAAASAAGSPPPLPEGHAEHGFAVISSIRSAQRPTSTPNRRVPASYSSAGLYRETPSPRAGMPHRDRGSPIRVPAALFASPSPPRYSGSELDPSDWASPIHPSFFSRAHSPAAVASVQASPVHLMPATSPLPPPPRAIHGQSQAPMSPPVFGPPLRSVARSPGTGTATSTPSASPAGRRTAPVVAAHHLSRSPSAPIMPSGSANAPATAVVAFVSSAGADLGHGAGDTPRNLTDWRRSMQGWKRQDEGGNANSRASSSSRAGPRVPWR